MRVYLLKKKKGQAVTEMAIFGSLIILLFGALLSHMQRSNDQHYSQMEAFRRALEKSCTYLGNDTDGAGASVQYTVIENRKHADLSGNFRKGTTQTVSGSSNVFWAVPKLEEGSEAQSLIVYKVNEQEAEFNYRDFVNQTQDSTDDEGNERQRYYSFEPGDIETESNVTFSESSTKTEDTLEIDNARASSLQEDIRVRIPYKVKEVDKDDESYEANVTTGNLMNITQHAHRDADGQYRYSDSSANSGPIIRSSQWETDF